VQAVLRLRRSCSQVPHGSTATGKRFSDADIRPRGGGFAEVLASLWRFASLQSVQVFQADGKKPMAHQLLDGMVDETVAGDARAPFAFASAAAPLGPASRWGADARRSPAPCWWPVICQIPTPRPIRSPPSPACDLLHPRDEGLVHQAQFWTRRAPGRASHLLSMDGDAFSWTQGREPDHQIEASASRRDGHPSQSTAIPVRWDPPPPMRLIRRINAHRLGSS
jgi:hypothetical protein